LAILEFGIHISLKREGRSRRILRAEFSCTSREKREEGVLGK